jgi:hypothetical protein
MAVWLVTSVDLKMTNNRNTGVYQNNMNINTPIVILCIACIGLLYALSHVWITSHATSSGASRKRPRKSNACPTNVDKTPPTKPWIWMAMKKWDTVQNMMKWKAEMASLDGVIQSIETEGLAATKKKQ